MAQIKSQIKRIGTNEKAHQRNIVARSALRTEIKKVKAAVEKKDKKAIAANDLDAAKKTFNECNKLLDKAVSSHIKHKNYAARQKSKLQKAIAKVGK